MNTTEELQARLAALESTDLRSLVSHAVRIGVEETLETVYRRFRDHPHEFVCAADPAGAFVGVISRGEIGFVLGHQFGFSLYARKPARDYLMKRPLPIRLGTGLREVLDLALSRESDRFHHDVVLLSVAGADYLGMIPVQALVRLQSELVNLGTRLAAAQNVSLRESAARHENEARLRLALDAGQMSVWRLDPATDRVEWSTQHPGADGHWQPGDFPDTLAQHYLQVPPEDLPRLQETLADCLARGAAFRLHYRRRRVSTGTWRWIETRGQPLLDDAGRVCAIVGVAVDVTERREAEEALHTATLEAERANHAKSEFLSRMSHELRTPLNAILGFGQLLELEPATASQTESVEQILRAGRHLLGLIDEVLDIARIEAGHLELAPQSVDLHRAVAGAFPLVQHLGEDHGVTLQNLVPAGGCEVRADDARLRQVLVNLLSNAIKYNRPGGTVTVLCACAGTPGNPLARLTVRDTGRGIAPDALNRLFLPFDRLGVEKFSAVEGTGIGLVLTKRLVEAMGGTIGVHSRPGEGSAFWIELPACPDGPVPIPAGLPARASAAIPPAAVAVASTPRATLLYIEDHASNRRVVENILLSQRPDLRLLTAPNGRAGLAAVRREHPDLILLDLQLPDLPGEEVLRTLRADAPAALPPVIVLTADATEATRRRLLHAGAHAYLTKPFNVAALLGAVDNLLPAGTTGGA